MTEFAPEYKDYCSYANSIGETNDCSVIATAVVTGVGYQEAHAKLAAFGRQKNEGMFKENYHSAIESMGFAIESVPVRARTVRTVERELRARFPGVKFLVSIKRHVMGFDGQKIVDWSAGRMHRVVGAFRITPKDQPAAAVVTPAVKPEPKPEPKMSKIEAMRYILIRTGKIEFDDVAHLMDRKNFSVQISNIQNPKKCGKGAIALKLRRDRKTGVIHLIES